MLNWSPPTRRNEEEGAALPNRLPQAPRCCENDLLVTGWSTRRIIAQMPRAYTPAEAAAVSEIPVKSVHNAIDKRIIARRLT